MTSRKLTFLLITKSYYLLLYLYIIIKPESSQNSNLGVNPKKLNPLAIRRQERTSFLAWELLQLISFCICIFLYINNGTVITNSVSILTVVQHFHEFEFLFTSRYVKNIWVFCSFLLCQVYWWQWALYFIYWLTSRVVLVNIARNWMILSAHSTTKLMLNCNWLTGGSSNHSFQTPTEECCGQSCKQWHSKPTATFKPFNKDTV